LESQVRLGGVADEVSGALMEQVEPDVAFVVGDLRTSLLCPGGKVAKDFGRFELPMVSARPYN
jgi:hypothetical protein